MAMATSAAATAALSCLLRAGKRSCLPSARWGCLSSARLSSGVSSYGQRGSGARSLRGNYRELWERAAREPGPFWGALAREALLWDTPHHTDCEWDFAQGRVRWFLGGRLNVADCPAKTTDPSSSVLSTLTGSISKVSSRSLPQPYLEMPGIGPGTFFIQNRCSTVELLYYLRIEELSKNQPQQKKLTELTLKCISS